MIKGNWFEKGSAASIDAVLHVDGNFFQLKTHTGLNKQGDASLIDVSDRLGNVQRKLTFEDGSVFSTTDNDAIDKAFSKTKKTNRLIHKLESKLPFVLISLVATIVISLSFIIWGIPAISSGIAEVLPQKTNEIIGKHTFSFLDKYVFKESALDQTKQDLIKTQFKDRLESNYKNPNGIQFSLHFRDWSSNGKGVPNALALPSGEIILTDKFVELSKNQAEINAVLLHEIGHIAHRHSLKMVIQSTLLTTVIMMATGDANGLTDMGVGLGSLLLSSKYSRHFELEADKFAFTKMLQIGIDPIAFSQIMKRITEYTEETFGMTEDKDTQEENSDTKISDYFSTHPATKERTKNAERYSECFNKGLTTCL